MMTDILTSSRPLPARRPRVCKLPSALRPLCISTYVVLFPFPPLPEVSTLTPRSVRLPQPPNVCGGEEGQDHLAASLIGEEVPDRSLSLPPAVPLAHGISRWRFQRGQFLNTWSRVCVPYGHQQRLGCRLVPRPLQTIGRRGGDPSSAGRTSTRASWELPSGRCSFRQPVLSDRAGGE